MTEESIDNTDIMGMFRYPLSFRQVTTFDTLGGSDASAWLQQQVAPTAMAFKGQGKLPPHSSHPNFAHLTMLVFEAVLEVVCVSLPGYIVARQGLFTAEMQKFTANLNVALFTPCLIFTKLASQLTAEKLVDLAIIPFIFVIQTLISFLCALGIAKAFGFSRRPRNFVIAMGVFGNSNSLPISLVLSLSKTIKGLHWDKVPNDNDDEVAARGILYLLIFQQLGQLVRWSWGYNVLLAPPEQVAGTSENINSQLESGGNHEDRQPLLSNHVERDEEGEEEEEVHEEDAPGADDQDLSGSDATRVEETNNPVRTSNRRSGNDTRGTQSGEQTPITHQQLTSSASSSIKGRGRTTPASGTQSATKDGLRAANRTESDHSLTSFPGSYDEDIPKGVRGFPRRFLLQVRQKSKKTSTRIAKIFSSAYAMLPATVRSFLERSCSLLGRFCRGVWAFMNPPLWAMLIAIVVASIPDLQRFFFTNGTFVKNSVTSAIESNAGVAVPLILVVLGGNLAGNTLPKDAKSREDGKEETKLLIASMVSRMVLPFVIMAPVLAIIAKYVPLSILDDPIFVIVCFLITGAPSALQLAQICQINNVYMGAMSRLLFQSYVIWILPSTLVLVMTALEVVEWAKQ